MDRSRFLPASKADMAARGIEQLDFVYISGDAYVDHPSFGTAIIARVLEASGFSVGIIAQPDWRDPASISALGEPRLGFRRLPATWIRWSTTIPSPKAPPHGRLLAGRKMGLRPDYAAVVYANLIRRTYKKNAGYPRRHRGEPAPPRALRLLVGPHEALRSSRLRRRSDLLRHGRAFDRRDRRGAAQRHPVRDITFVRGTVYKTAVQPDLPDAIRLPGFDKIATSKELYAKSFYRQYLNTDPFTAKTLVEPYPADNLFLVQNLPQKPLSTEEMDAVYACRMPAPTTPDYEAAGVSRPSRRSSSALQAPRLLRRVQLAR